MNEIIKDTRDYVLEVALSYTTKPEALCYRIVNKKYNVIEIETFLLPQALKYLDDLQAGIDAIGDMTLPRVNFEA